MTANDYEANVTAILERRVEWRTYRAAVARHRLRMDFAAAEVELAVQGAELPVLDEDEAERE